MARKLPWKAAQRPSASSSPISSRLPQTPTRRPSATTCRAGPARHHQATIVSVFNSDPLRSPSTSPPPEPPQERYMISGDDQYRIVEDELLQTAQRFTTHLHRAEYNRLKLIAKSKNDAAIREIERPVVGPLTSDAKKRRDQAKRLSKQRSILSATDTIAGDQDGGHTTGDSPWLGVNLRGLLNAPRTENRSLAPQATAPSSLTKAAAGRRPQASLSTPQQLPNASNGIDFTPSKASSASTRARHPVTPSSSNPMSSSSSAPSRQAKVDVGAHITEDDDLDLDDPFGLNKRRLDRQNSRVQQKKSVRSTPTNTLSSSDAMPSFM